MKNTLKLDVLLSCMHQKNSDIVLKTRITGNAIVINQCDLSGMEIFPTENGLAKIFHTTQRGLTKSRNMALEKSAADICILCDDDEVFLSDYRQKILTAYRKLPDADVIIFKMADRPPSFKDKVMRLRFPLTMKVSSWQISFKRASLMRTGVRFDELMGAGTGNGAEEELKFLCDCEKAGLRIYYVPSVIASVKQTSSTWFGGYNEKFFKDRGNTTRYVLGLPLAAVYAVYYAAAKHKLYSKDISAANALRAMFAGIFENRLGKLSRSKRKDS